MIDHPKVIVDREPLSVTERVHTPVTTEPYYSTSLRPTEETETEEEEKEGEAIMPMCANIEDKQEMIRCKLIACWKDNQYCYWSGLEYLQDRKK